MMRLHTTAVRDLGYPCLAGFNIHIHFLANCTAWTWDTNEAP